MPMRSAINLILAVLVAGAAILLWIGDTGRRHEPALADIDPSAIGYIAVTRKGEPDLAFRKLADGWRLLEPIETGAHPARVNAILGLPRSTSHERLRVHGTNLQTLQLDPPLASVSLDDHRFDFGGTDPIDERRYVRSGDRIHLINDRLFHLLTQPVSFYIDVQILPDDAAITRITYPEHTLFLENDRWQSRPEPVVPGTAAAVTVDNWRNAEAQRVLPYRRTEPAGKVVIKTRGEVVVFDLIAARGGVLLARPGRDIQYQLTADTAARLGLSGYMHE